MVMAGHRPPRRPKKRARNVQKQLDVSFVLFFLFFTFFSDCFWCFSLFIYLFVGWLLVLVTVLVSRIVADGGNGGCLQGSGVGRKRQGKISFIVYIYISPNFNPSFLNFNKKEANYQENTN